MIMQRFRWWLAGVLTWVCGLSALAACVVAIAIFPPWPALIVSAATVVLGWLLFRGPVERLNGMR